ncbi:MAG: ankyrin repeat domain-containing protein, partial [Spirochaetota bacterium]
LRPCQSRDQIEQQVVPGRCATRRDDSVFRPASNQKKGANIHAVTSQQNTTLHSAAIGGNIGIAKLLLTKNSDILRKNSKKQSPFHVALKYTNLDIAELFLSKEAGIYIRGKSGNGLLEKMAFEHNVNSLQFLLQKGLRIGKENEQGAILLQKAAHPLGIGDGIVATFQFLISQKADIHAKREDGSTLLHNSHILIEPELTKLLLAKGLQANAKNQDGRTPLHEAALSGYSEEPFEQSLKLLIRKGAKIHTKDKEGNTPLALAKENDNEKTIELLQRLGAKR